MGVLAFVILLVGFGLIAFMVFNHEIKYRFRKYKPDYFGQDVFQRVTSWQASEWQVRAKEQGITLNEWQRLCDEQLHWVETALKAG